MQVRGMTRRDKKDGHIILAISELIWPMEDKAIKGVLFLRKLNIN